MSDSSRVTGQPAPPTPRLTFGKLAYCEKCGGLMVTPADSPSTTPVCARCEQVTNPADHTRIANRIAVLREFLLDNKCFTEQKHLDEGSPERIYWHYGYLVALRDISAAAQPLTPPQPPRFCIIGSPDGSVASHEVGTPVPQGWFVMGEGEEKTPQPPLEDVGFDEATEARWQLAIYKLLCKHVPAPGEIDGGGCDSGDALDFTLTEIEQAIEQVQNPADYTAQAAPPSLTAPPAASLTAEELAPFLRGMMIDVDDEGIRAIRLARSLCSLPGIKVVRG